MMFYFEDEQQHAEVLKWVLKQRPFLAQFANPMKAYYDQTKMEYEMLRQFLPQNCYGLLDIGAGMAGVSTHLLRLYAGRQASTGLAILEKSGDTEEVSGFVKDFECHTDTEVAKKFVELNSAPRTQVMVVDPNEPLFPWSDLVVSFYSWGWHYSIDVYLPRVLNALPAGGTVIVDVRAGHGQEAVLLEHFDVYAMFVTDDLNAKKGHRYVLRRKQ